MATLPVLHLKATSRHNVTITTDPYETTATLYTFLRSVPSAGEVDLAMQPFIAALHTAPSSGAAALMRRPNHRLVQRLEAVAVDEVFRWTPSVLPALARHTDGWKRCLGCTTDDEGAGGGDTLHESALSTSALSATQTPSKAAAEGYVRGAELQQFTDPYAAYEADYQTRRAASMPRESSNPGGKASAESRHSPAPPRAEASYFSAEVSELTAATNDASLHGAARTRYHDDECEVHDGAAKGAEDVFTATGAAAETGLEAGVIHPVLDLIAHHDGTLQRPPATADGNGLDATSASCAQHGPTAASSAPSASCAPLSDAAVEAHIERLTHRLADASAAVTAAMAVKEEAEEVWSPSYSRLKTAMLYTQELQGRVRCATSLFQLERYERETLQQAHIGIAMETMSLQLVLRDVRARLEDEEPVPTAVGNSSAAALDARLLEELSAVLGSRPA